MVVPYNPDNMALRYRKFILKFSAVKKLNLILRQFPYYRQHQMD